MLHTIKGKKFKNFLYPKTKLKNFAKLLRRIKVVQ